jgi:hypothetical protein
VVVAVGSALALLAVTVDLAPARSFLASFHGGSVLLVLVAPGVVWLGWRACGVRDRATVAWSAAFASLVGTVQLVGRAMELETAASLGPIAASGTQVAKSAVLLLGTAWLTWSAMVVLLDWVETRPPAEPAPGGRAGWRAWSPRRLWWTAAAVLVVARLPYLVACFPGNMTRDSLRQWGQAVGELPFTGHHPPFHTLIIRLCAEAGIALGDPIAGVVIYSVLQVLATCAVFAWAVARMARWGWPRVGILAVLGLWALLPLHGSYAMTMWKDVPFGLAMLAYTVALVGVLHDQPRRWRQYVPLAVAALAVALLRNNGPYVVALSAVVLVVALRPVRRQVAVAHVAALAVWAVFAGPVVSALHVEPGSSREALSVPLQFMARVARDHPDRVTDEQAQVVTRLLDRRDLADLAQDYNPRLSDPVKLTFDDEYFASHTGEFVSTYLGMLVRSPDSAVEALVANSYGYYYPEVDYWKTASGIPHHSGYPIPDDSWGLVPQADERTSRGTYVTVAKIPPAVYRPQSLPLVGMLQSLGFQFLVLAACVTALASRRRWQAVAVTVPLLVLWLTCLASPVFAETRYAYALFTTVPLVVLMTWVELRRRTETPADGS